MRIIQVLHSHRSGGAERHARQLMLGLRERGHELIYAGPTDGWLGDKLHADGFPCLHLPMHGLVDLPSIWRLARHARQVHADLIHGHLTRGAWYAGWAARLASCPNVATAHSDNAGKHFGRADRVIAVSQAVADFLRRSGVDPQRLRTVHHGIADIAPPDLKTLRSRTREELGLPADEPVLLMAARLVSAKGHDTAFRALATLTDQRWTLLLAGDHLQDLGPQLMALVQELGLGPRVRFLGLREDVPSLLVASDVLLAPSRREALSLTLLEASACALPIVASRVGGIGEVVEDGVSGRLVPADDPGALAQALLPLLEDPALRHRWGAAARQIFETRFTEGRMFDKTEAVYREVCTRTVR